MTVHLESDTPVHQVVEQKVVIGGGNTSMACFVYGSVGGSAPTLTLGAASYDGPLHPLTDGPPKPWINPPGPNPQNPIQGPFETEIDEEPHQDYHIYTSAEGLDSFQYATNMVTDEYGYAHQWVNAGPATNALYFQVVAMVTNSWP